MAEQAISRGTLRVWDPGRTYEPLGGAFGAFTRLKDELNREKIKQGENDPSQFEQRMVTIKELTADQTGIYGATGSYLPAGIMYDHEQGERHRIEVECPWERRPTYTKVYGNLCIKGVLYFEELYEDKEALRSALQVSLKSLHKSMENEAGIHEVPTEQTLPPKKAFTSKFLGSKGDDSE